MLISQGVDAAIAAVFGLLIGSFLNVVIYRLPKMLEAQWAAECAEQSDQKVDAAGAMTLSKPRSSCRQCGHQIRWYENIPVLSFLLLRGKCSACGAGIGWRYPLVELAMATLSAYCVWRWGVTPTAMAWAFFSAAIVCLALIDWDTTLLPDDITLLLLWVGLVCSSLRWIEVHLINAVWGAAAGYLSLWLIYKLFKLLTGREGMGYGDFKLFAALGAWFGWEALVPIILMSSVIGATTGIGLKVFSSLRPGGYVPFGPFLATAGLTAMVFGPHAILRAAGL